MNTVRTAVRKGFTLVEILIVVVILGILAAIVIPQFSSASQAAQASSLVTQLQSVRSQLELYQLQHNGNYPDGANIVGAVPANSNEFWAALTEFTDVDGEILAVDPVTGRPAGDAFGPYLQKPIQNPFIAGAAAIEINSVGDVNDATAASNAAGWSYSNITGEIRAHVPAAVAAEVNFDVTDGDVLTF